MEWIRRARGRERERLIRRRVVSPRVRAKDLKTRSSSYNGCASDSENLHPTCKSEQMDLGERWLKEDLP